MSYSEPSKSYGKRPLWQWILLYALIGGVIYVGVYYFIFAKKSGYNSSTQTSPTVGY